MGVRGKITYIFVLDDGDSGVEKRERKRERAKLDEKQRSSEVNRNGMSSLSHPLACKLRDRVQEITTT